MKRLAINRLLLLCLVWSVGLVHAATFDREQPVTIEADRVDVDEAKGTSVYSGHVVLRQGSMELQADELHIKTTAQRELETIIARGKPARFKQLNDPELGELRGRAREITYRVTTEYMLFVGDAYFWQCGDEVSGEHVEYFGEQALVKARKAESGQGRVQVTLQPRDDEPSSRACQKQGTP